MSGCNFIIGVDEVGRGPLAGPVAVGAVLFTPDFDKTLLDGVRDSKLVSEKKRERWAVSAQEWELAGIIRTVVEFASAQEIDTFGISKIIANLVARAIQKLAPEAGGVHILLDGSLHAPNKYSQETIIHGDALHPEISLTSIIAKVQRDRMMVNLAQQFPQYGFEKHKGYGTKAHLDAIKIHGLCELHRRSFCKNIRLSHTK